MTCHVRNNVNPLGGPRLAVCVSSKFYNKLQNGNIGKMKKCHIMRVDRATNYTL